MIGAERQAQRGRRRGYSCSVSPMAGFASTGGLICDRSTFTGLRNQISTNPV
jgi:hypothetical protein